MIKNLILILFVMASGILHAQDIDHLIQNNEFDKALQIIDQKLIENDSQPELYLKRGVILQKRFDFNGAVTNLEKAYLLDSLNPTVLSEIAEANASLGNQKKTLVYLKSLYRKDTSNVANIIKLVRGYLNLRIYKEPFEILQKAYNQDSTNLLINKQLALCSARTGHEDLSVKLYNKVISLNPFDPANYTNLASVYQTENRDTLVIETLEKGLNKLPEEPQLLIKSGDFHLHLKEYAKAIIPYEMYLAKVDSAPEVLKNLGICYFLEKKSEKGRRLLEKSMLLKPDDPVVYFYIGMCYEDAGNFKKSIEYLNTAAKVTIPDFVTDIYHHLGIVYNLKEDYPKAIASLKKAYEEDTSQCSILFEIATIYDKIADSQPLALRYFTLYLKAAKEKNKFNIRLTQYSTERKRKLKAELNSKVIKKSSL